MWDYFPTAADKQKYMQSLYSPNRVFGCEVRIQQPTLNRQSVNKENVLVGSGITFESSATGANVFNLGGANIDTATVELAYGPDLNGDFATGIDVAREDYTFVELRCGYGTTPYNPLTRESDAVLVPLNVFTIQSKSSKLGENKYTLKLQSLMSKLDQSVPVAFNVAEYMADEIAAAGLDGPTPYIILQWICKMCCLRGTPSTTIIPLDLSSNLSDSTYTANLANWDKVFNITNESGYTTYRDILKDIATICGAFATFVYEGNWEYYESGGTYGNNVAKVPSRLTLIPYMPYASTPVYLNNGDTSYTPVAIGSWSESDIMVRYSEDVQQYKIEELRYRVLHEETVDEQKVQTELNFDTPGIERDYDFYYDISNVKLLDHLYIDDQWTDEQKQAYYKSVSRQIYNNIGYVTLTQQGVPTSTPNYQPIPYNVTTAAPDFRFQLGDWCRAVSRMYQRGSQLQFLQAIGQLMKISWKSMGTCTYCSYNSPTANDRNASKRSSYAEGETAPGGEGGNVPPGPEPEPPVIILDSEGQWLFGDEAALIEEAEAMARPGEIVHLSVAGQWNFGGGI